MRCTSPRTVGFAADGKTISWSPRKRSKEYASFQLPCGKCIECRLDYARQWAIRCVHEAQMHENSCFITLTYSDENLTSPKLVYSDFQKFMKRLRRAYPNRQIGVFVTGEYGEKTKRPHWHAILFGWAPADRRDPYVSPNGDTTWSSDSLSSHWGKGHCNFGTVTFHSAGYCARYAAKKLVHGPDGHDFEPISKKSSKHAIGKRWLEKHWSDVFNHGQLILADGSKSSIPRYYEKWFKEHHPTEWLRYVTQVKIEKNSRSAARAATERSLWLEASHSRPLWKGALISPEQRRRAIINAKFKTLQENLKL